MSIHSVTQLENIILMHTIKYDFLYMSLTIRGSYIYIYIRMNMNMNILDAVLVGAGPPFTCWCTLCPTAFVNHFILARVAFQRGDDGLDPKSITKSKGQGFHVILSQKQPTNSLPLLWGITTCLSPKSRLMKIEAFDSFSRIKVELFEPKET